MEKEFELEKNKTCEISLERLKTSCKETYTNGNPCMGAFHFQVIDDVLNLCEGLGLNPEVTSITLANNTERYRPGATLNRDIVLGEGDDRIKAYILRRVFTIITLHAYEQPGLRAQVAIAYSQRGIAIGIGREVSICTNSCIFGADHLISNYSLGPCDLVKTGVKCYEEMKVKVSDCLVNLGRTIEDYDRTIRDMQNVTLTVGDVYKIIGRLTYLRLMRDGMAQRDGGIAVYALNQKQTNSVMEKCLPLLMPDKGLNRGGVMNLWEMYNYCTAELKPDRADIPSLLQQNLTLFTQVFDPKVFNEL